MILDIKFSTDEVVTLLMVLATADNEIVASINDPALPPESKAVLQKQLVDVAALAAKIDNAPWSMGDV
jgi:hypothetical protein